MFHLSPLKAAGMKMKCSKIYSGRCPAHIEPYVKYKKQKQKKTRRSLAANTGGSVSCLRHPLWDGGWTVLKPATINQPSEIYL